MSCVPPRRFPIPTRAAWEKKRDARRQLLEKVRARRRLMLRRTTPVRGDRD